MDFGDAESSFDRDKAAVETPFVHQAAANGAISVLVNIIQRDPSLLELQDEDGLTPLGQAVLAQRIGVVKQLLKMGASINAQDNFGRTTLALAAYQGWYDGIVCLLRNGARQHIADRAGRTPLHAATYPADTRILLALVQSLSVDEINQPDSEHMTAVHWASFHNHPEHVRLLMHRGGDIMVQDVDGKTPLHWAAQTGCTDCCDIICQSSESHLLVNVVDHTGKTAVHFAAAAGHCDCIQCLASVEGSNLEAEDPDDRTPLHWAAAMGQPEATSVLLKYGVDPLARDVDSNTALDYAHQSGYADVKQVLKLHLGIESSPSENHIENSSNALQYNENKFELSKSARNPFKFLKDLFSRGTKARQAAVVETSARNVDTPDMEDAGSSCDSATSSESRETTSSSDPGNSDNDGNQAKTSARRISESAPYDYLPFNETKRYIDNSNSIGHSEKQFIDSNNADVVGDVYHSDNRLLGKREMIRDHPSRDHPSGGVPHNYQEYSRTERLQSPVDIQMPFTNRLDSLKPAKLPPIVSTGSLQRTVLRKSPSSETFASGDLNSRKTFKSLSVNGELAPIKGPKPNNALAPSGVLIHNKVVSLRHLESSFRPPTPPPHLSLWTSFPDMKHGAIVTNDNLSAESRIGNIPRMNHDILRNARLIKKSPLPESTLVYDTSGLNAKNHLNTEIHTRESSRSPNYGSDDHENWCSNETTGAIFDLPNPHPLDIRTTSETQRISVDSNVVRTKLRRK